MGEVREFALPDLGEGLTEATIVRWLVAVGDPVRVDEPVVEVETAKAMVEVPCPYAGVVTSHSAEEGAELPVGAPLVTVAVGPAEAEPPGGTEVPEAAELEHVGGSGNVLVGYGTGPAPARRGRVTAPAHPDAAPAREAGPAPEPQHRPEPPRGTRRQTAAPADRPPVPVISPLVRRLAREHAIDLRELTGTGPDGLILRADVERALRETRDRPAQRAAHRPEALDGRARPLDGHARHQGTSQEPTRIPLRGLRATAAERVTRSRQEIPDATCWVDADATELLAVRRQMNAPEGHGAGGTERPAVSLLALLARVCTAALARYPALNATVDTGAREVVVLPEVHLGFAAQTERGLMVPVVRDAHTLTAEELTREMTRLTEAARAGKLTPAELTGGTFTLNNYGVFGVDGSTPIINHPEAAMLGVGRIARKPWVVGDELAVRDVVQLSLTFDHRVCDGGTAGGFLRHVADCVERPAVLLRTL